MPPRIDKSKDSGKKSQRPRLVTCEAPQSATCPPPQSQVDPMSMVSTQPFVSLLSYQNMLFSSRSSSFTSPHGIPSFVRPPGFLFPQTQMPSSFQHIGGSSFPHPTQMPLSFQQTGGSSIPHPHRCPYLSSRLEDSAPHIPQRCPYPSSRVEDPAPHIPNRLENPAPHIPHMYVHVRMIMCRRMMIMMMWTGMMMCGVEKIFEGMMIRVRFMSLTGDFGFGPKETRKFLIYKILFMNTI